MSAAEPPPATPLLLQVEVDGRDTGLVVAFAQTSDGGFDAARDDLAELRLVDGAGTPAVPLSTIAGLRWRYDAAGQLMRLTIAPDRLTIAARRVVGGGGEDSTVVDVAPGRGFIMEYDLFASATSGARDGGGWSASLSARRYWADGDLSSTGLIYGGSQPRAIRLETTWRRLDPALRRVWTVGDSIGGASAWSRPIRFAGVQLVHDFATRPDLVTTPLPSLSGSAAVPSALDVYINGARAYADTVPEGRFRIDDLPAVSGAGVAKVVTRDLQGREMVSTARFFVSTRLLRAGLTEYAIEAGVPRLDYGVRSARYARRPFAAASGRAGLAGGVTLEGHAELSGRVAQIGGGATASLGGVGVVAAALAGSVSDRGTGALGYLTVDLGLGSTRLTAESVRTTTAFDDLAGTAGTPHHADPRTRAELSPDAPRATDRLTLSLPLPDGSVAGLTAARDLRRDGPRLSTFSAGWSRALGEGMSFNANLFRTAGGARTRTGLFAALTASLGPRMSAGATASGGEGGSVAVQMSRVAEVETGSLGWRVGAATGERALATAGVSYRAAPALLVADLAHDRLGTRAAGSARGALILAGGRAFVSAPVEGGFAIVDAGAPGVPVLYQNRPVGRSGHDGLKLVTGLRPFERNDLAIDPGGLPSDRAVTSRR